MVRWLALDMVVAKDSVLHRDPSDVRQRGVRGGTWVLWIAMAAALWMGSIGAASPVQAQDTAVLQGTVRDAVTDDPLPLANVVLEGTERGVSADSLGRYRIGSIAPGRYTVVTSYVGYQPYRQDVVLDAGATQTLDIRLMPEGLEIGEVTVTGRREQAEELGAATLTPEAIKDLPAVLEPDVFRSLQLLPGVKAASDFSSGLYIRGGSPDQTLVLLDHAPVYNPSHVFGFFSTFNPDAVGNVLLYKGGFPAVYGGRLGSVVDIESRRGDTEETRGGVSLGLLASRVDASGPYEHGTWMVAARRSTLEPLLSGLNSANVDDVPRGFYFYDLNGTITLRASPRDRLALALYAGRDQLDYPFLEEIQFDVAYGNRTATLDWQHLVNDRLSTEVTATASHYFSTPVADISGTTFRRDNDVYDLALTGTVVGDLGRGHTVEVGVNAGRFVTHLENRFDAQQIYSPNVQTGYGAAYVQDTYRPSRRWELKGGLRASYYTRGQDLRLAPRLSVEHRLADRVRLQAGYGRYYQYLSLVNSELFSAFDFWLATDERVPPMYGDQFIAGIKTQPTDKLQLDAEVYYRTLRNLFQLDERISDYTGLPYRETLLFGEGYAYGAEVTLRRSEGRINGFVGYTLGRTERRYQGFENNEFFPPKHDRTHDLTAVLNLDVTEQWRATAVFTYATGQAYTEPSAQFRQFDGPFSGGSITTFVSDFNAARLPPYHRLDLGLRKRGRFFGIADYEAQVQLVNAYGRRNIWFYLFQTEDDGMISRNTVPQLPIPLPNLSLTLRF